MSIESKIRQLARSSFYQTLYNASEKIGVSMFDNHKNLSGIQIQFLYWCQVYKSLYEELATHESEFLTENVIKNDFRCNCYLIHRNKKNDFIWKNHRHQEKMAEIKNRQKQKNSRDGKVFDI